jgi:hypothetical protein
MESFKYTPILMLTTDNTQDKKDNGKVVGGVGGQWLVNQAV